MEDRAGAAGGGRGGTGVIGGSLGRDVKRMVSQRNNMVQAQQ